MLLCMHMSVSRKSSVQHFTTALTNELLFWAYMGQSPRIVAVAVAVAVAVTVAAVVVVAVAVAVVAVAMAVDVAVPEHEPEPMAPGAPWLL